MIYNVFGGTLNLAQSNPKLDPNLTLSITSADSLISTIFIGTYIRHAHPHITKPLLFHTTLHEHFHESLQL